jgi:hypothetical protein
MRLNILKKVSSDNRNTYKTCEKNVYLTKMDLFYGGLGFLLECSNLHIPFNYQLEEVKHMSIYKINDINGTELFLLEIVDPTGVDFD